MERLAARGVDVAYVTLHVGLDTFRPVEADDPREHHIHTEYAVLPPETARAIARARDHAVGESWQWARRRCVCWSRRRRAVAEPSKLTGATLG